MADDLERIGNYVRANLPGWLRDVDGNSLIGPKLLERMVRVEEELKRLMERSVRVEEELKGMGARFERGFAAQRELMAARFEAVDKRFETVDKRFEDMQRRIAGMQWIVGTGFALIMILVSLFQFFG